MNINRKFIISASSLIALAAPIAGVIACSPEDDINTITFAMRAADYDTYKPIMKKFKELTGIDVKFKIVSSEVADYTTWSQSGSMPDVLLADYNTVQKSKESNNDWFRDIDLNKFKSTEMDIIHGEKKVEYDLSNEKLYDQSYLNYVKVPEKEDKIYALPYSYAAGALYVNTNLIDETKNIKALVPNINYDMTNEKFVEVDTGMKATMQNIKRFILSSADEGDWGWDTNNLSDNAVPLAGWENIGPLALEQRIMSLGISVTVDSAPAGWEGKSTNFNGLVANLGFDFAHVASVGSIFDENSKQINDDELKKAFPNPSSSNWDTEIDKALKRLYKTVYGYFGDSKLNGSPITPTQLGLPGKAEAFYPQRVALLSGAKWYMNYFNPNWAINGKQQGTELDKQIDLYKNVQTIPLPYYSVNYDTFAIGKNVSDEKYDNVIKFIRFLMEQSKEYSNAYDITFKPGVNVSPVIGAQEIEKNNIDTEIYYDLKQFGVSDYDFDSEAGINENDSGETIYSKRFNHYKKIKDNKTSLPLEEVSKIVKWYEINSNRSRLYKSFIQAGKKYDKSELDFISKTLTADSYKGISGGVAVSSSEGIFSQFGAGISQGSESVENIYKGNGSGSGVDLTYNDVKSAFRKSLKGVYSLLELSDIFGPGR